MPPVAASRAQPSRAADLSPSGADFEALRTGGLLALADVIAVRSGFSDESRQNIKRGGDGLVGRATAEIDNHFAGTLCDPTERAARLYGLADDLSVLALACREAAALVLANPGRIDPFGESTSTGRYPKRVFP